MSAVRIAERSQYRGAQSGSVSAVEPSVGQHVKVRRTLRRGSGILELLKRFWMKWEDSIVIHSVAGARPLLLKNVRYKIPIII